MTYLSRRRFNLCLAGAAMPFAPATGSETKPWVGPAMVKKVYVGVEKPTWPRPDLDFQREVADIEARLAELERKHPGKVRFTGGERIRTPEEAVALAAGLGDADAVLVLDLTSSTAPILRALREVQTPMLLFTRPYSGWSYLDFANWVQNGKKADLVASSEFGDLDAYMRVFHTMHHLRHSRVLVVRQGRDGSADGYSAQFGTRIDFPGYARLKAAYDSIDPAKAQKAADEFVRAAVRVVEPSREEILDALRFYLGVERLLAEEQANAISIDCLGGFRRGDLPAYPCVAWSKLNDRGLYGVCEADLPSTMTQILVTSFCDRPGFVSDPVFDTSKHEVIHAHCVAATCMQGVGGAGAPYIIRSHMEDNQGVSMQVMMPVGDTVTVAKFVNPRKLVVSTGEMLGNVDSPRGCRTQFRTRVPNARKMLENYAGGLHRVVFWGDYVEAVEKMGRLMGFQVVREI